jgi:hypothetical protein
MSDWDERIKAAEAGAERLQAAEEAAEASFKAAHGDAQPQEAMKSDEFHSWMATRRATDDAWGKWATLMDAKSAA